MDVKQIYTLINGSVKQSLGESALTLNEDLSNLVDIGNAIFNANAFENFSNKLIDHIGKVVYSIRKYSGTAPSVKMDAYEFGSILEKIRAELPEAQENESWELQDGASYDEDIFTAPKVSVKFFNGKKTWEIPVSYTKKQLQSAFSSIEQMNGFLSMLAQNVNNAMTLQLNLLTKRTINNMIGETAYSVYSGSTATGQGGTRCVNLLYEYNNSVNSGGTPLTTATALYDKEFLKYACRYIRNYINYMKDYSVLFNEGGTQKFTPEDMLHCIIHTEFATSVSSYVENDMYKDIRLLPKYEEISNWQGVGTSLAFADTGKVSVKTASNHSQTITGVLGVLFDREALGVANLDQHTTSKYNNRAEFFNEWHKGEGNWFNDFDENFVVFFIG